MPTRISGKVYGDLTGSIFEPQVKSIANVDNGTLPVAHGGTGLNLLGASGSALVSDGTSLVYAVISGGSGGVTAGEVSGAINQLTASISSSFLQIDDLNGYATIASLTDYVTTSSYSASIDNLTASISSSYVQNSVLLSYSTKAEVTGAINQLTSSLSSSYVQNTTLNNYALKSGVTFTGAITASSGISSSLIRFPDGTELTSSTGLGGGLSSVYTDGNITGSGLIGDKIGLKDNITLTSITASLFGTASYSSLALSASYASNSLSSSYSTTAASASYINNIPNSSLQNSSFTLGSTLVSLGDTATIITGISSITATNFTGSLSGSSLTAISSSYSTNSLSASYATTTSGQLRLVTGAERAAISPSVGLMLYQTDTSGSDVDGVYVYKSSGWVQMI